MFVIETWGIYIMWIVTIWILEKKRQVVCNGYMLKHLYFLIKRRRKSKGVFDFNFYYLFFIFKYQNATLFFFSKLYAGNRKKNIFTNKMLKTKNKVKLRWHFYNCIWKHKIFFKTKPNLKDQLLKMFALL